MSNIRRAQNLRLVLLMIAATWLGISSRAVAVTRNWIGGSSNWNNNGNWSPFGVPDGGDIANIISTGTGQNVNYDYGGPAVTLNSLTLDLSGSFSQFNRLNMAQGTLSATTEYVGKTGRGAITQIGGMNNVTNLRLADEFGAVGSYTLSDGAILNATNIYVSRDVTLQDPGGGTATMTVNEGAYVNTNFLGVGQLSSLALQGGTLRLNAFNGSGLVGFSSGTLRIARASTLSSDNVFHGFFPSNLIFSGQRLVVEGFINVNESLYVTGQLEAEDFFFGNDVTVTVASGGSVTNRDISALLITSPIEISVSGAGSSWTARDLRFDQSSAAAATLRVEDGGFADLASVTLGNKGVVIIDGGTLQMGDYFADEGATVNFLGGTVQRRGNRTLGESTDVFSRDFLGKSPMLTAGKTLVIEGVATLKSALVLDGGTFSAGGLVEAERLDLRRGSLDVTNQVVTIGGGGTFQSLDVGENVTFNSTLGLINAGLVTGDGRLGGTFYNSAGAELRAQAGRSLSIAGAGHANDGLIRLFGGELEFHGDLTNNAGANISGNGSLIVDGGLTNLGTMNFAGTTNIVGNVVNAIGGKVISGGGGATVFYDDVTNDGEIRTSTNGFTVFFGSVSGSGTFTGTGTVNFEGDLSPGSSPTAVQFAGDVELGADAKLEMEIGGTSAGTDYDQLVIAGDLALGGTLNISLINGFAPIAGQSFNIFDWIGTRSGTFSSLNLPAIFGLMWDTSQLYSMGVLSVTTADGLLGDYNQNGVVDAADYTIWRNRIGEPNALPNDDTPGVGPDDYTRWKQHFGESLGSGAVIVGDGVFPAVPEPSSALIFCSSVIGLLVRFKMKRGRRVVL